MKLPPTRRVAPAALLIIGVGAFLNLYATQPLLPYFRRLFHESELAVSLTVSATTLAVALTAPVVGSLSDRLGRKGVIVTALFGLACTTVLSCTAHNLPQLIVWRFLQGCFIPGIIAATMAYTAEESEPAVAGSTMSLYVTGTIIGGFGGRFIAGLTVSSSSWRAAFGYLGLATFLVALATWWLLPGSRKFVRQHTMVSAVASMRKHLHNPRLLATYAVGFNILFCLVAAFTYVNFYLTDKPFFLGPATLGSIFGVYLIGLVVTPMAGRFIDRAGHRKTLMGALAWSAAGMFLTLIHSVPLIIAGLAMEATGVFACQSVSSSYVGKAALEAKSSAAGLYVSFYYLGGFMGSILPGLVWKQAGWLGCVAVILSIQCITILTANRLWQN